MKETDHNKILQSINEWMQTEWKITEICAADTLQTILLAAYLTNDYCRNISFELPNDIIIFIYEKSASIVKYNTIGRAKLAHPICCYEDLNADIYDLLQILELCVEDLKD